MRKPRDLTGERFGRLVAVEYARKGKRGLSMWLVRCDCGNTKEVAYSHLVKGGTRSCGCLGREVSAHINDGRAYDIIGQVFGRLTVVKYLGTLPVGTGGIRLRSWLCICECGNEKETTTQRLVGGRIKSCGCLALEANKVFGEKQKVFGLMRIQDLTGRVFSMLTVLRLVEIRPRKTGRGNVFFWLCRCECGNEKAVERESLVRGDTRSCGCVPIDRNTFSLPVGEAAFNRVYNCYKNNAKVRGYIFDIGRDAFKILTQAHCHYCGREPSQSWKIGGFNGNYIFNGLDRVDNDLDYTVDNVVTCCKECNKMKHTKSQGEFLDLVRRIYENLYTREAIR